MPTGYTAPVQDGKVTTLNEYAWSCCRAFGAFIMMRDEGLDAPIPERFAPSDYHAKAITAITAELASVEAWSDIDARRIAMNRHESAVEEWRHSNARTREYRMRYEAMLARIREWKPPTPEHVEFARFMESQIIDSMRMDCHETARPELPDLDAYKSRELQRLADDMAWHEDRAAEERKACNERNAWVDALRTSLGPPPRSCAPQT